MDGGTGGVRAQKEFSVGGWRPTLSTLSPEQHHGGEG